MSNRQFQALESSGLYQPGLERQVARVVGRSGREQPVPGTGFTLDELQHYQRLGRRLQARAVAAGLSGLVRAVLRPLAGLAAGFARARRHAAAIRDLGALDDRMLADIGISRGQIPAVVAGLEARNGGREAPARRTSTVLTPRTGACPAGCNDAHAREAA